MQNDGSVSPVRQFLRHKWARLGLFIFIIVIVGIAIFLINTAKTASLILSVAPVDASIQLNGQGNYANGVHQIQPGTYEVAISHDGLNPKTFTVDLESGHVTMVIAFLSDNGNFDFYALKDNYISFQKLAEIASQDNNTTTDQDVSAEQFIQDFQQNYQLYQTALPADIYEYQENNGLYTTTQYIAIEADKNNNACQKTLCIKAKIVISNDTDSVINFLQDKGFNLKLIEVEYEEQ